MAEMMRRAVQVFLNWIPDEDLLEMAAEKKLGERYGYIYFLGSSDIEAELSRRFDTHLSTFFGI